MYESIKQGVSEVLKIAGKNPILIECRNNNLYIGTYTDYHKVVYESKVAHEDFSVTIPIETAKDLPEIFFDSWEVKEGFVELKNGNNKTKISTAEETLLLRNLAKGYEKENNAKFLGEDFKNAFNYTRHASNDKSLGDVVLRGFHFLIKQNSAEIMASNGSILSLVKIQQIEEDFDSSEMLLLNSEFSKLLKLIGSEEVLIGWNESSASITYSEEDYTIRAITARTKGSALPYENVVESTKNNVKNHLIIDKQDFLNNVKQLKTFSQDRMTLSFYNTGEFTVSSNGKHGEATRDIKILSQQTDLTDNVVINMNISNLFSYLLSTRSDSVKLSFSDSLSPLFFEDSFGIEILAPLRK